MEYERSDYHVMNPGDRREAILWYLGAPDKRPAWLRVDRVFGEMGDPETLQSRPEAFPKADGGATAPGRSSAIPGPTAGLVFRGHNLSPGAAGADGRGEELRRRRWTETDLERRRKGDGEKVRIAARLRVGKPPDVEMNSASVAQLRVAEL